MVFRREFRVHCALRPGRPRTGASLLLAALVGTALTTFLSLEARASDCDTWQQLAPLPGPFYVFDMT